MPGAQRYCSQKVANWLGLNPGEAVSHKEVVEKSHTTGTHGPRFDDAVSHTRGEKP